MTPTPVPPAQEPYGLMKLRRAFEDSQNRTGQVVGLPPVTIDVSHVAHVLAHIAAQAQQLQSLRERVEQYARHIIRHGGHAHLDHACSQCVSGGELIQPGFVCVLHDALAFVEASESAAIAKGVKEPT